MNLYYNVDNNLMFYFYLSMWNWFDTVPNTPNRISHECSRMCVMCVCLCVALGFTFSSSWYFMILCTGLMSRSFSCSLWPSCCFSSYTQTHTNMHLIDWFLMHKERKSMICIAYNNTTHTFFAACIPCGK